MTPIQREQMVRLLKRSQAETIALITPLTEAQLTFKPATDRWSAIETAEHVMLAEGFLFRAVQRALSMPRNPDWEIATKGKAEFLETELGTRLRKAHAPERLVPSGKLSRGEVLDRFEAARAETLAFAENIDAPLEAHTLQHPFPVFSTLNAYQWLLYIPLHNIRHNQQIAELLTNADFPKS